MPFDELVGEVLPFYGVCGNTFKVDNTVFRAIEKSHYWGREPQRYLAGVAEEKVGGGEFSPQPLASVRVELTSKIFLRGYRLIDVDTRHVWLEFGTSDMDDWCKEFVFEYTPPQKK